MRRKLSIIAVLAVGGIAILAARADFWDDLISPFKKAGETVVKEVKEVTSCPGIRAKCMDGLHQVEIDAKSTKKIAQLECRPCLKGQGCGKNLEAAIKYCHTYGGLDKRTLTGVSLGGAIDDILDVGAKAAKIYSEAQGGVEAAVVEEVGKTTREAIKAAE